MSNVSVLIIGAGFGGLGAAKALRDQGITDVTILERADDVGGVWRENTYPNAACDVPSVLYSWSFATKSDWSRRFGTQPEIHDYIRTTAADLGLVDLVRFGVTVTAADHDGDRWQVSTASGETYTADLLIAAVGQLSEPVVPSLPGHFDGPAFHSAHWRHDLELAGRRVAVIGTGASAIQFVPGIVDRVAGLTLFQRTAPYVVPKPDQGYRPRHHRLFARVPALMHTERRLWFALTERFNAALVGDSRLARPLLATIRAVWRLTMHHHVKDADLRTRLTPDFPIGCKRLLFSNAWYPALAREHVEVVSEAITGLEPSGVRTADGTLHEVDIVIWGTGFAATQFLRGIEVTASGRDLHADWERDGARAHLGMTVPGFPNLFVVYGPNTNLGGSSIIAMLEAQAGYIARVAGAIAAGRAHRVAPRREVADAFDAETQARLGRSVWSSCDSWYAEHGRIATNWPGLVADYQRRLAQADLADLEEVRS